MMYAFQALAGFVSFSLSKIFRLFHVHQIFVLLYDYIQLFGLSDQYKYHVLHYDFLFISLVSFLKSFCIQSLTKPPVP